MNTVISTKGVLDLFLGNLKSKKTSDVYEQFSSALKEKNGTLAEFEEFFSKSEVISNVEDFSFEEEVIDENNARHTGWFETSDGKKYPVVILMEKENEIWKVSDIDIKPAE